jgi:hypothetical protein
LAESAKPASAELQAYSAERNLGGVSPDADAGESAGAHVHTNAEDWALTGTLAEFASQYFSFEDRPGVGAFSHPRLDGSTGPWRIARHHRPGRHPPKSASAQNDVPLRGSSLCDIH